MSNGQEMTERIREAIKTGRITFSKNKGESAKDAIVIRKISEVEGVHAVCIAPFSEHEWLASVFGKENKDWKLERQAYVPIDGKRYDIMTIKLSGGGIKEIYFDITDPFSKLRENLRSADKGE